jgi:hypothetical protein
VDSGDRNAQPDYGRWFNNDHDIEREPILSLAEITEKLARDGL